MGPCTSPIFARSSRPLSRSLKPLRENRTDCRASRFDLNRGRPTRRLPRFPDTEA
jgi:hypothetical protein